MLLWCQAAVPEILEKTSEEFFSKTKDILRAASAFCYDTLKEIPCITCPQRAEGAMFVLVKTQTNSFHMI